MTMEPRKESVAAHYKLPWFLTYFAKILDFFSRSLATRFLWKIFSGPIKFKVPSRELDFYNKTKQTRININSVGKKVILYRLPNDGNKLLFVHGWNGRSSQFYRIIDLLSEEGFDITAVDLPGHGRSRKGNTSLPEITDVIYEISKTQGPYHALIGHSFGGIAALNAVRYGSSYEKLVLISPGVYKIEPMFKTFVGLFGLNEEDYTERMFNLAESKYGASPDEFSPGKFANQIDINTLIIHCEDDKEAIKEIAENLHGELKNSILNLTTGLGHRRILRDADVAEKITQFMKI